MGVHLPAKSAGAGMSMGTMLFPETPACDTKFYTARRIYLKQYRITVFITGYRNDPTCAVKE